MSDLLVVHSRSNSNQKPFWWFILIHLSDIKNRLVLIYLILIITFMYTMWKDYGKVKSLQVCLLSFSGIVSVPAPVKPKVLSNNFIQILEWSPGKGTQPGTVYNMNIGWVDNENTYTESFSNLQNLFCSSCSSTQTWLRPTMQSV